MTVTIVIVGQQVALRSTIKIRNTTMIASGGAGLKIHQEMADAPLHTGRRSNKKSKDLKWQKNSFCQRLGWQLMRQRVCLQTFNSAMAANILYQLIYFTGVLEITFQLRFSIVYAITKEPLWLSSNYSNLTSHWWVSLQLLGTVISRAPFNLTPRPLFTNMIQTVTKLLLVLFHMSKLSTTRRFLGPSSEEVNLEYISSKTIKV